MPLYLKREDEVKAIKEMIAQFPPEFGLQAWPGRRFRISQRDSYWSSGDHCFWLYTEVWLTQEQAWTSFSKGTLQELQEAFCKFF